MGNGLGVTLVGASREAGGLPGFRPPRYPTRKGRAEPCALRDRNLHTELARAGRLHREAGARRPHCAPRPSYPLAAPSTTPARIAPPVGPMPYPFGNRRLASRLAIVLGLFAGLAGGIMAMLAWRNGLL